MPPDVHASRAAALARWAVELAAGVHGPVCAYLPIGTEPGTVGLVEALRGAGSEVLLPVVGPPSPSPLDWARFDGVDTLGAGPLGLREPTGPRLGQDAVARAGLVLVPALAADRGGRRLGRGGGFYDWTLPLAAAGTPLVVVLNDEELVDRLPVEPHDRRVTAALLPSAGVTRLGNRR
jgi:5-formyltetrahydrofolate cyclo-ligase